MRRSIATPLASLALALTFTTTPALAQVRATLPGSIVESASVGGAERQQIEAFVAELSGPAKGSDAEAAAKARLELVTPLRDNRPSVSFRQAYARAATPLLGDLLGSDQADARIAGLRLAGNLATGDTATMIAGAMQDPDAGVRLFAGTQARRVFEVSAANGPALTDAQAAELAGALNTALKATTSPVEAETYIRALAIAAQARGSDLSSTRARSILAISTAVSNRVRGGSPSDIAGMQDIILIASNALTRALSDPGVNLNNDSAKAAAEMGGDVLAVLLAREIDGLNDRDNTVDIRLLRASESLVYFARRRVVENAKGNPNSVPQTNLAGQLESGDRSFRTAIVGLIGSGSGLLREFGLPNDRFIK